jgi:HEAT repeat protein
MRRWRIFLLGLFVCCEVSSQAAAQDAFDKLLEQAGSRDIRAQIEASLALKEADLKDPGIRAKLWGALRASNPKVRQYAASALGESGVEKSEDLSPMVELLADSNALVRATAMLAIARNSQVAGPSLIRYLNLIEAFERQSTGSTDGADYLTLSLAASGPSIVEPFLRYYNGFDDTRSHPRIGYIFRQLGRDAAPALQKVLVGTDPLLKQRALTALGIAGSEVPFDTSVLLDTLMTESSADIRAAAILAVGGQGETAASAVPALTTTLVDSNPTIRQSSAEALGRIGSADAIPALITALDDEQSEVRREAVVALGAFGPKSRGAVSRLILLLENSDPEIQIVIVQCLGSIGDKAAVPALEKILAASKTSSIRVATVRALGRLGKGSATTLPVLASVLLNDPDSDLRNEAAAALGSFEPASVAAVGPLVRAAEAEKIDWTPSLTATIRGLWKSPGTPSFPLDLIQTGDPVTSAGMAHALGLIGPEAASAVPELLLALRHKDPLVRYRAAEALGFIGPKASSTSAPALVHTLRDKDDDVRGAAARALGRLGASAPAEAIQALENLLKGRNPYLREAAAQAFGDFGSPLPEAIPKLVQTLKDKNGEVASAAADALGSFGPAAAAAVPPLVEALRARETHSAAIRALGLIRSNPSLTVPALINTKQFHDADDDIVLAIAAFGSEAVPHLVNALQEEGASRQLRAVRALGRIGQEADAAIPSLLKLLNSETTSVRHEAFLAAASVARHPESVISELSAFLLSGNESIREDGAAALLRLPPDSFQPDLAFRAISSDLYLLSYVKEEFARLRSKEEVNLGSVLSMPLYGRNFSSLELLTPGVSVTGSRTGGGIKRYPRYLSAPKTLPPREPLPAFPYWPPPVPSARRILPNERLGGEKSTLGHAYGQLASALENAGFLDHALFEVPDGFAVTTKMERIHPDGSSYEGSARWTRDKLPLRSFSLVEYLGRLLWETPGQFRLFVFVFSKPSNVPTGSPTLSEREARILAVAGGQQLPEPMRGELLQGYNCQVLIYHFEKKLDGDASIEIPSTLGAVIHLAKAHLWTGLAP